MALDEEPTIEKCNRSWWILDYLEGPIGPYDTKAEAVSSLKSMRDLYKHEGKPGYVTTDKKRRKLLNG